MRAASYYRQFSYVRNNPVNMVDPDGRMVQFKRPYNDGGGEILFFDPPQSWVALQAWDAIIETTRYNIQVRDQAIKESKEQISHFVDAIVVEAKAEVEVLFTVSLWQSGNGDRVNYYGPDDSFTKSFEQSSGADMIYLDILSSCFTSSGNISVESDTAAINTIEDFFRGAGLFTPQAQMGAFNAYWPRTGSSQVDITVVNLITVNSLVYQMLDWLNIPNPPPAYSGPLGTVYQVISYSVADPCSRPRSRPHD
jgi:hypothetical protein